MKLELWKINKENYVSCHWRTGLVSFIVVERLAWLTIAIMDEWIGHAW